MANTCVFCGKKLPRFGRKEVICFGTTQPACASCYDKLIDLPHEERCRLALDSGRAVAPDIIRTFLAEHEAEAQTKREQTLTDKICLRCDAPMLKMGRQQFQLGEYGLFWGDMAHLMAGSLTLDMLYCEKCRKVEFFLPDGQKEPNLV